MAIKGGPQATDKKFYGASKKDKSKPPPSKVVIRRMPPGMTFETFREQVSPLPDHDYISFVPADLGLAQHAFSRAYINFLHMDDIITFRDRFDGYVFVDKQGFEFPAIVEFAPYQRTPRRRARKPDVKAGTIGDDADYLAFLEACHQPDDSPPPSWEVTLEEIEKRHSELRENQPVTPLVTFVCRRRAEKKEERRRRELERRKEDTRKIKEKLNRDKREAREKERHEARDSSKVIWSEERDRKRDDGFPGKKYDDKSKEKHFKHVKSDKDDKYDKRKERVEKWKDADRPKRDERMKKEEERRKESDWEDRRKKTEKHRPSESSSESVGARGRDAADRPPEANGGGDSAKAVQDRPSAEAAMPVEPSAGKSGDSQKQSPGGKDETKRKEARPDRRIKNKDRPALAIYRPGMGKYSSRRLQERDSQSASPTPSASGAEAGAGDDDDRRQRTLVFRRSRAAPAE